MTPLERISVASVDQLVVLGVSSMFDDGIVVLLTPGECAELRNRLLEHELRARNVVEQR